ncbi:hypothetical protein PABG_04915 [Paracoccidioides brasiliensis Pb03]|uniref:SGNH hydrolase-type esterase domain-containing protein n=2 Tax=Paracoccidioides brasiliensis TaxID=121759 RepID=C1GE79_PARBD|nr:uncharacterized protein PADG_05565 [Paracoccidioides brasiliensis Pb18]EEH22704.1 hypothetical protein PABG_04915 [Paracoccidioides brasiliensis Pb03]EEH49486.2 hypothetical protein PADG_05565 [Paracoccidioides brasiliensis Pb18]ODH44996.1 hypothetical protein ACO22_00474 [Paracoccidioides brasiliensis]
MIKETKPNDYPRIYLFGDSLTERARYESDNGFAWKLGEYYDRRVEVVNAGYSGQTTKSLRKTFEKYIIQVIEKRGPPAPLFISIFLGANDACLSYTDPYVPLPEFEEHIRYYVNSIVDHSGTQETKVILITPPPVDIPSVRMGLVNHLPEVEGVLKSVARMGRGHRTWASKRAFAEKIVEIGKEFERKTDRVAVLDFWTAVTKFACEEKVPDGGGFDKLDLKERLPGSGMPGATEFGREYFIDGLHFGSKGYEILTRELFGLLLSKWPELEKQNFPLRDYHQG